MLKRAQLQLLSFEGGGTCLSCVMSFYTEGVSYGGLYSVPVATRRFGCFLHAVQNLTVDGDSETYVHTKVAKKGRL